MDSYIPFFFTIPEFALIYCIRPDMLATWFYSMSGFIAVTLWAYIDMDLDNRHEKENEELRTLLGRYRVGILFYIGSGGVVFFLMGYFAPTPLWKQIVLLAIVNVLLIGFTLLHDRLCWKKVVARAA